MLKVNRALLYPGNIIIRGLQKDPGKSSSSLEVKDRPKIAQSTSMPKLSFQKCDYQNPYW